MTRRCLVFVAMWGGGGLKGLPKNWMSFMYTPYSMKYWRIFKIFCKFSYETSKNLETLGINSNESSHPFHWKKHIGWHYGIFKKGNYIIISASDTSLIRNTINVWRVFSRQQPSNISHQIGTSFSGLTCLNIADNYGGGCDFTSLY